MGLLKFLLPFSASFFLSVLFCDFKALYYTFSAVFTFQFATLSNELTHYAPSYNLNTTFMYCKIAVDAGSSIQVQRIDQGVTVKPTRATT